MPCMKLYVPSIADAPDGTRITNALCREPGVYGAVANCGEKVVEIDFEDDEVSIDRLMRVVRGLGHTAHLAG